jgi:hypothetical protein
MGIDRTTNFLSPISLTIVIATFSSSMIRVGWSDDETFDLVKFISHHPTRMIGELKVAITIVKLIGERKLVGRSIPISRLSHKATITTIVSSTKSLLDKNLTTVCTVQTIDFGTFWRHIAVLIQQTLPTILAFDFIRIKTLHKYLKEREYNGCKSLIFFLVYETNIFIF